MGAPQQHQMIVRAIASPPLNPIDPPPQHPTPPTQALKYEPGTVITSTGALATISGALLLPFFHAPRLLFARFNCLC
jgi:hypothetical protein